MGIMPTDQWLLKSYDNPLKLCKHLEPYFDNDTASQIQQYLSGNGMYRRPAHKNKTIVDNMRSNQVWETIHKQWQQLQKKWLGPDVPIFIFPADPKNRMIHRDFHGKAGITFPDKILLFISDYNEEEELQALFTHEYNHACRMNLFKKNEANNSLLDSITLEGLAEHAVAEEVGETHLAEWTNYYSEEQLQHFWEKWIKPNKNLPKFRRKHFDLLFGSGLYPKMLGYSVGYHLVGNYVKKTKLNSEKLLGLPSHIITDL